MIYYLHWGVKWSAALNCMVARSLHGVCEWQRGREISWIDGPIHTCLACKPLMGANSCVRARFFYTSACVARGVDLSIVCISLRFLSVVICQKSTNITIDKQVRGGTLNHSKYYAIAFSHVRLPLVHNGEKEILGEVAFLHNSWW